MEYSFPFDELEIFLGIDADFKFAIGVGVLILTGFCVYLAGLIVNRQLSGSLILVMGLCLGCFYLALMNPFFSVRNQSPDKVLIILQDLSESAQRSPTNPLPEWLASFSRLAVDAESRWSARLAFFGESAHLVEAEVDADNLLAGTRFEDRSLGTLVGVDKTNIAGALNALAEVDGEILLVSDGLENEGDAVDAATRLATRGRRIHVIPLESPPGRGGLGAIDVPKIVNDKNTVLRGITFNYQTQVKPFDLQVSVPDERVWKSRISVPPQSWQGFRQEIDFPEDGLQPVSVAAEFVDGSHSSRELYTFVVSPLKVAVLGNGRWLDEERFPDFVISRIDKENLFEPTHYDVVIIDGLKSQEIPSTTLRRIRSAVEDDEVGFLLVNGPHDSAVTEDSTLLTYKDTPIDPLLPVSGDLRMVRSKRPNLNVQVQLDVSGSMCSSAIWAPAREMLNHIACKMKAGDSLEVITFDNKCNPEIMKTDEVGDMCDWVKRQAIPCRGGGTNPSCVADYATRRFDRSDRCATFFISDTLFNEIVVAPECASTVIAVGSNPDPNRFQNFEDFHAIGTTASVTDVDLIVMEPKPREEKFVRGRFRPVVNAPGFLPEDAEFSGHAISYLRKGGERIAARPWPKDPLLVFSDGKALRSGVFTSEIPDSWRNSKAAAESIKRWMQQLARWSDRHRFLVQGSRNGENLQIDFYILDDSDENKLHATIAQQDEVKVLRSSALSGGRRLVVQLPGEPGWHRLEVSEQLAEGKMATQEIPLYLPRRLQTVDGHPRDEYATFGSDTDRLRALAQLTGGYFDAEPAEILSLRHNRPIEKTRLWPLIAILGGLMFLFQIYQLRQMEQT